MKNATYLQKRTCGVSILAVAFAVFALGCGSGFSEILFQAVSAVGRSALDGALTDIANDFADAEDAIDEEPAETGDEAAPDDQTGADDTNGGVVEDLVGDPVAGEPFFTMNGCSSCHCDDASGGCALDAPNAVGVPIDILTDHITGDESHPVKLDLTPQDLADLQAYLSSLGP